MSTDKYLHLDAQVVKAEVAKLVSEYPELAEDETLRLDMLEAETGLVEIAERIVAIKREAETIAEAIKGREADLYARRHRYERQAEAMKRLARSTMQAAGLTKLTLTEATISITSPRTTVNVTNPEELPQGYFSLVRKPDAAAIKAALQRGDHIPGAELATGEPGTMFRTK